MLYCPCGKGEVLPEEQERCPLCGLDLETLHKLAPPLEANRDILADPEQLKVGQILKLPQPEVDLSPGKRQRTWAAEGPEMAALGEGPVAVQHRKNKGTGPGGQEMPRPFCIMMHY